MHHRVKRHAKKLLIPHKENQFRPHLIRLHGLIAVLVVALVAQTMYGLLTTGQVSVLGRSADIVVSELLDDTNAARAANGLPALTSNDQLTQAATLKAQDMFREQYWAHTSPKGVEPWYWVAQAGYSYSAAGENLAKNYPTAGTTVEAWMNSPTHRDNILHEKYTEVGFAVQDGLLEGKETVLVVALYGAPPTVSATVLPTDENQAAPQVTITGQPGMNFSAAAVAGEAASNPTAYFATALQALSPATIIVLAMFGVVAIVAVAAHHYRSKLPKEWRQSWKSHHGLYTLGGILLLGVLLVVATGGGTLTF